jgi:hypothetical protein
MVNESLSFHVKFLLGNDFVLPAGYSSVDVLRIPLLPHIRAESMTDTENARRVFTRVLNLTSTKFELWTKKLRISQSPGVVESAWQKRLLIVTEKRLFIVTKKQNALVNRSSKAPAYEIVDSIPMEEMISLELEPVSDSSIFVEYSRPTLPDYDSEGARLAASNKGRTLVHVAADNDYLQHVLQIATRSGGFNHGQKYYFLLRKQDRPTLLSSGGETARVPVIAREVVEQGQVKGWRGGEREGVKERE